jgi:predicted DNA-binding protein
MTKKFIPVESAFEEWCKDPEYVKAYDALEEEFAADVLERIRKGEETVLSSEEFWRAVDD